MNFKTVTMGGVVTIFMLVVLGMVVFWPPPSVRMVKPVTCTPIGNGDCQTCPFRAVNDRLVFHCQP